mmetsp:Transcript_66944/g.173275  ORF Transcript_66944/g.173275 Transcript_66944/m.173275 type:complete len:221 (+) Transcript_66944:1105-1767(+)
MFASTILVSAVSQTFQSKSANGKGGKSTSILVSPFMNSSMDEYAAVWTISAKLFGQGKTRFPSSSNCHGSGFGGIFLLGSTLLTPRFLKFARVCLATLSFFAVASACRAKIEDRCCRRRSTAPAAATNAAEAALPNAELTTDAVSLELPVNSLPGAKAAASGCRRFVSTTMCCNLVAAKAVAADGAAPPNTAIGDKAGMAAFTPLPPGLHRGKLHQLKMA